MSARVECRIRQRGRNVRSGRPTAESRRSPSGQLWSFEFTRPSVQSTTCHSVCDAPASRYDARRIPTEPKPVTSASCRLRRQRSLSEWQLWSSCRRRDLRRNKCCRCRREVDGPTCSPVFRGRCTNPGKVTGGMQPQNSAFRRVRPSKAHARRSAVRRVRGRRVVDWLASTTRSRRRQLEITISRVANSPPKKCAQGTLWRWGNAVDPSVSCYPTSLASNRAIDALGALAVGER